MNPGLSVRVSWAAPPPQADATRLALQALAEAAYRLWLRECLDACFREYFSALDAAEAARWADDGGRL